jgi:hypothetical protein
MSHRASWLAVAVVLIVLAGAAPANAATCNWIEDQAAGDWRDAGNWDCGVVPDGDDDVVIDGGLEVVQLEGQDEAANSVTLTTFGRLQLGGGTLAIGAGGLSGGRAFIEQPGFVTVLGPWTHSADELTIQDGANVAFNGSASFTGGELALDDSTFNPGEDPVATFNGALTLGDGVIVSTEGAQEIDRPLRIGATGSVTARSATINVPTRNSGTFTVASNETLFVVSIFEQVTGGTTTLESGGVFDGDIRLGGGTLTGQGTVFDGVLNDGGTVDPPATGTLTIGGMTQQSGQTVVAAGETLNFNKSGVAQLGGTATVSSGGTLTVSAPESWQLEGGTMLLNGTLDGRLFMNRGSTGTLTGGGTVSLDSTLREGTIAPGTSAGTLTFQQDLLVDDGATLEIEIGGSAPGTEFDRIEVGGEANLDAHVEVTLINSFKPPGDSQYQFLTSGSRTGTFRSVTGAAGFSLSYPGAPSFGARLVAPPTGPPPANTSPPTITEFPTLVGRYRCNPGTWNPGGNPTKFEWYRVVGPNSIFITETSTDFNSIDSLFSGFDVPAGWQVFCRVTMTNDGGSTTADSAPITLPFPPVNTSPPTITAASLPGYYVCNPGTWDDGVPVRFQWYRLDGPNSVYITEASPDANSLNNLFSGAWVPAGSQIFCRVSVTNWGGSVSADSAPVTVGGPPQPNPQPVPPSPEELLAQASPAAVAKAFGMPSARRCLRTRKLKISLKIPAGVKVKKASLVVRGKTIKLRRVRGRLKATIDLRGLPNGRLPVVLKVTTASGEILRGKLVYRKCAPKRTSGAAENGVLA